MKSRFDIRFVLAVLAAVALMGWFLAGMHWDEAWEVLKTAEWKWVAASAFLLFLEYPIRSWRWYYLVGEIDEEITFAELASATNIGAAFNTFVPLRGGDIIRIAVLARKRGLAFATVLSTTVVERLFDAVGILGALFVLLYFLPADIAAGETIGKFRGVGMALGAGGIVLLGMTVLLGTRGAQRAFLSMIKPLPKPMRIRVFDQFRALVAGLAAVGNPMRLIPALLTTALIWVNGYFGVLCAFWAFHLDVPNISALFINTAVILSVAIPQAPGFIGLFQVVLEEAMGLWGASTGQGEAMALALWALYFLPVTMVGVIDLLREGQGLGGFREDLFDDLEERAESGTPPK